MVDGVIVLVLPSVEDRVGFLEDVADLLNRDELKEFVVEGVYFEETAALHGYIPHMKKDNGGL